MATTPADEDADSELMIDDTVTTIPEIQLDCSDEDESLHDGTSPVGATAETSARSTHTVAFNSRALAFVCHVHNQERS